MRFSIPSVASVQLRKMERLGEPFMRKLFTRYNHISPMRCCEITTMDTRNIRLVRLELGQYNAVIRITDIHPRYRQEHQYQIYKGYALVVCVYAIHTGKVYFKKINKTSRRQRIHDSRYYVNQYQV